MSSITLNWPVLKPLLVLLIFASLSLYYIYFTFLPPTSLYSDLFTTESDASKKLIHNELGNKYVKFRQLQGAGFNNQAQEILLFHHLALQSSRIYVYQPFIWRPRGEKAEVPLSAFLRGPTEGTISSAVFDEVCPPSEVSHINLQVEYSWQWEHALTVLSGKKERCIVVDDWIFNWNYLSSPGIHTIWPTFRNYISIYFQWSKHVLDIVDRTQIKLKLQQRSDATSTGGQPYMALHLRRGDFEDHCNHLATTHQGFTTWATLPELQSSILDPVLDTANSTSVLQHCYPSLYRVLDAVSHQARRNPKIRTLHVLHDGAWDHPLVFLQFHKLAHALRNAQWAKDAGWTNGPILQITQSSDIPIQRGERDWSVCVDVELARRAAVFIGNGYSSLSTQIVALRLGSDKGKADDITLV